MANEYLKPQIPLKDLNSENYFYPLTTLDQVQKVDGSRVQEYELGNVIAEEGEIISNPEASEISALMNAVYPIGSIYMSVNATSPTILFGGTWEQIEDTFLLAAGTNYTGGDTGGSTEHTHTIAHTHTVAHSHSMTHTHTMAHTHPQVATTSGGPSNNTSGGPSNNTSGGPSNNTSGGPSNNTSGGTAITVAQMPSHNHVGRIPFNQSGYGVNISGWVAYINSFNTNAIADLNNGSLNNINARNLIATTNTGSGQAHTHTLSSHTHSLQSHTHSLQSHTHTTAATTTGGASNATTSAPNNTNTGESIPTTSIASNENSGSTSTLPPYLVVYMWKRTA